MAQDEINMEQLKRLYVAVNDMMAQLGAIGEISTTDARVSAVMDALRDIDGGDYDPDKVFLNDGNL